MEQKKYFPLNGNDKIQEGDEFLNEDCETWTQFSAEMIGRKFNHFHFRAARREIKQPEVLTEQQMWEKYVKETGSTGVFTYGKLMHQNGRLERDIDYKPFFDAFLRFRRSEGIILKDLCEIFENIQPLED